MKNFRLYGKIRETESGNGIPDLIIEVKDADLFIDELITATKSGRDGLFETAFLPACREKPDIYLNIKAPDGRLIASTHCDLNTDEESNSEINLNISRCSRIAAGLGKNLSQTSLTDKPDKLISWTFLPDQSGQSRLLQEIQEDMSGKTSILELLKQYMNELCSNPANALPFDKLMEIFRSGVTPEVIEGHLYGVWMFFRTGDQ